jgi:GT2 family glycosyltransferase
MAFPMPAPEVSIVILNFNTKPFLAKFLPTVLACSPGAAVVVADNGSTDGSVAWVQAHHPEVQCIVFAENHGFCKGYNLALQQISTPFTVFLNSDVEVTPGWLEPMLSLLKSDPQVACCQPKLKSFAQPTHFEYAGAAGGLIDALGYPFAFGRLFDSLEEDTGQYDQDREVFWASGACLCTRTRLFTEAGGFDQDFFAHMEEIDWCWRVKRAGYRVVYVARSVVYHVGGGTLPKTNPRKTYYNFRNNLCLLLKNLPWYQLWWILSVRLCLDGLAALQFLRTKGGFLNFRAVIMAHFGFYSLVPVMWKRRTLYTRNFNITRAGRYGGCIIWKYFVAGKTNTLWFTSKD